MRSLQHTRRSSALTKFIQDLSGNGCSTSWTTLTLHLTLFGMQNYFTKTMVESLSSSTMGHGQQTGGGISKWFCSMITIVVCSLMCMPTMNNSLSYHPPPQMQPHSHWSYMLTNQNSHHLGLLKAILLLCIVQISLCTYEIARILGEAQWLGGCWLWVHHWSPVIITHQNRCLPTGSWGCQWGRETWLYNTQMCSLA